MSNHQHTKRITTKDIQRMTNDEIIKYVYLEHKRLKMPVEDVWELLIDSFGKQTLIDMRNGSDDSWNNNANFEFDGRFGQVMAAYVFAFGFIWFVFYALMNNKYEALQFTIVVCGILSAVITMIFMNSTGKNEKNYLNAINKVQKAYSVYINKGFNDLMGKPLDYVKNEA